MYLFLPVHIRILSSCTSKKTVQSANALTITDAQQGPSHLKNRESELSSLRRPAVEMYAGQQHKHLMRGIHQARRQSDMLTIDLGIISAFYGLVNETTSIAPYDSTFSDMTSKELRFWADQLQIPEDTRAFISSDVDLNLILLGEPYVRAAKFTSDISFGGPTLFFCAQSVADRLPTWNHVKKVVLSRQEAKRFSQGLVWLKGWMASQLLSQLVQNTTTINRIMTPTVDICDLVDQSNQQLGLYDQS